MSSIVGPCELGEAPAPPPSPPPLQLPTKPIFLPALPDWARLPADLYPSRSEARVDARSPFRATKRARSWIGLAVVVGPNSRTTRQKGTESSSPRAFLPHSIFGDEVHRKCLCIDGGCTEYESFLGDSVVFVCYFVVKSAVFWVGETKRDIIVFATHVRNVCSCFVNLRTAVNKNCTRLILQMRGPWTVPSSGGYGVGAPAWWR